MNTIQDAMNSMRAAIKRIDVLRGRLNKLVVASKDVYKAEPLFNDAKHLERIAKLRDAIAEAELPEDI